VFSLPDDLTEPFRYMYGVVTEIEKPRLPMTDDDHREIAHYRAMPTAGRATRVESRCG